MAWLDMATLVATGMAAADQGRMARTQGVGLHEGSRYRTTLPGRLEGSDESAVST